MARHGLARRPKGFDLLDDIRARGTLRIAIEPDFKGLSFRKAAGGTPLGLDIANATAFARSLGVDAAFAGTPERVAIERQWQGGAIAGAGSYRDEPGGLRGAAEPVADYAEAMGRMPTLAPSRGGVALRNVA